jgi:dolichyl-phosphate-mannose-protein mannosyltransferase
MKKIFALLLFVYFIILCININSTPLFIGDEQVYSNSVLNVISGNFDLNNHPLLTKTIWAFFVFVFQGITGSYLPIFWRLGTLICSVGIVIVFYKIARIFFSNTVSVIAVILLALDPMFFSMSRIMQPDIPALFFGISSLYYFIVYQKGFKQSDLYNSAILGGLSLASKMYAIIPILLLPLTLFLYERATKTKIIYRLLFYYVLVFLGFTIGNFAIYFLSGHVGILHYISLLFNSQLTTPFVKQDYLTSPAISWFTIPQIMTLFRNFPPAIPNTISTVVVLQNPVSFIITIPALFAGVFLTIKEKVNKHEWISILLTFAGIYLPWFFNLHMTYYYYILPTIPIIILLVLRVLEKSEKTKLIYLYALLSFIIFIIYFPLLNGLNISKKYESSVFQYSQYKYPPQNRLFCKQCSPRN